jgi:GcrA cell cycle regulator
MKNWSEVDDAAVRQHFMVEQKSYGQIALLYEGATVGAVAGRCRRLGLKRGNSPLIGVKRDGRGGPVIEPPVCRKVDTMSFVAMRQATQKRSFVRGEVRLEDLTGHSCRWPVGDPREEEFGFCGDRREGEGPYCAEHHKVAVAKTYKG